MEEKVLGSSIFFLTNSILSMGHYTQKEYSNLKSVGGL